MSITFAPAAAGQRSASLVITDSAPNSPQTINLNGTGTTAGTASTPLAAVSPSSAAFGNQLVGTTSAAQQVTLSNTGKAALAVSSISASAGFSQTNSCGSSVAAGGSCAISITFNPTAAGPVSGALTVIDNSNGVAGSSQSVSLTGSGTAPAPVASVSTSSLSFSGQMVGSASAAQTVTLSNSGKAALSVAGISTSGNFSQTNTCGTSVAAGGSCTIGVAFAPTSAGAQSGALTITDNSNGTAGSTQTVNVSGAGQDFTLAVASGSQLTQLPRSAE